MNDTTMPPPKRVGGSAKAPAPRNKQGLRKGFGLTDWMQLLRASPNLAQRQGGVIRRDITKEEVKQHKSIHNGWMILNDKVYNIAPYLHYHPGGADILVKCLGRDGTSLFMKYHPWVNVEGLIGPLLLGYLKPEAPEDEEEESAAYIAPAAQQVKDGFAVPAPRPPAGSKSSGLLGGNDEDLSEEDEVNLSG